MASALLPRSALLTVPLRSFADSRAIVAGVVILFLVFLSHSDAAEEHWWHDACGGKVSVRHSRSADNVVQHQLKHVITIMDSNIQSELNILFPQVRKYFQAFSNQITNSFSFTDHSRKKNPRQLPLAQKQQIPQRNEKKQDSCKYPHTYFKQS